MPCRNATACHGYAVASRHACPIYQKNPSSTLVDHPQCAQPLTVDSTPHPLPPSPPHPPTPHPHTHPQVAELQECTFRPTTTPVPGYLQDLADVGYTARFIEGRLADALAMRAAGQP